MSRFPFSTAIKSKFVFRFEASTRFKYTVASGVSNSLHRPVFFTWQRSTTPLISTSAINRLGRDLNIPLQIFGYFINSPCKKKTPQPVSRLRVFMLALPIFPGRRQPSIVGAGELNFCVRYGNRWTLTAISTNFIQLSYIESRSFVCLLYHTPEPLSTGDPYRI